MDPTPEEKQNELPQQKQSKRGFPNPLRKIGSRVVAQVALRGFSAFLAGPGLPIAIAIIAVFVFTFIIVGFGGTPPSETNQSPTAVPTQVPPTPTPTPAGP